MHTILFFCDARGKEPVKEFMAALHDQASSNKHARVQLNKINDYVQALAVHGTRLGMPYIRHIDGDIWELRPTSDRIFFFCHAGDSFVLLHHFHKKTQATPKREIEQSKRNMQNFLERVTQCKTK